VGAPERNRTKEMNSRVSWSVDSIDPSVRKRAEAAARRAGLSLNEWLNSRLGDSTPPNFRERDHRANPPSRETREVADIHRRLDSITRQIERISRPQSPEDEAGAEPGVARQLNDAISRLDARLSQISNRASARPVEDKAQEMAQERAQEKVREKLQEKAREKTQQNAQGNNQGNKVRDRNPPKAEQTQDKQALAVERAAAQVYRNSPPLSPVSLDAAVAEIAARQTELDSGDMLRAIPLRETAPPPPAPPPRREPAPLSHAPPPMREAAPAPPAIPPGADFSRLERYLLNITSQIEALQRPNDDIEQSIAAFRSELAEIRQALTEAMPRRAIEQIENDIRALSRRIDENRQSGSDTQALASIERALGEIREVLRSLTPAEQLTGYDAAIRNLTAKLDLILRENDDPGTVEQLEGAISALRAIVSNIASNDALVRLADDVRLLSTKVDQLTRPSDNADSFASLEQRIAALTSALESRERPSPAENSEQLEGALRSLTERIDRLQVGNDSASALAHLEQRVTYLLERLEASSDPRSGNLVRVEDGLQDVLRHLERQQETFAALVESRRNAPPPSPDTGLFDLVKRELTDIRFSQTETDRLTQDSLEAVHNTLGHVVDRLAMIENDLRTTRSTSLPPAASPTLVAAEPPMPAPGPAMAQQARPELPNPAASEAPSNQAPFNQMPFAAAPRNFQAAPPPIPAISAMAPKAISEILEPPAAAPRPALAPELPPDHPLEPGTRPGARLSTPSERIAASESAISEIPANPREPVSSSSFIAAARRAAQAAAAQPANDKSSRKPPKGTSTVKSGDKAKDGKAKEPSTIASKIRSVLVGVSVVVIVLAAFKMAMSLLDGDGAAAPAPTVESPRESAKESIKEPPPPKPPAEMGGRPAAPDQTAPSLTSPTPIGRQSFNTAAPSSSGTASVEIPQTSPSQTAPAPPGSDVTGAVAASVASAGRKGAMIQVPASEKLPEAIGGPTLRAAALRGDPAAAYEIGLRFAEGKGLPPSLEEAAKWYDRAAQTGLVPAVFRLGTFYEKGLGVKRDLDLAHRYYLQAAERGNAKAMHNLAVLDADGGGKGANYTTASAWFRKAADRGVADSQYNLGILYARGIGVEQNLAESYKWFSLAAAQGDADAGRKRDDVAKRLDAQSLAAAKLAIQTFTAEPQPEDAVIVPAPAGGWDNTPAQANAAKPAAKPPAVKHTASAR
jgi:localization factor PodJL